MQPKSHDLINNSQYIQIINYMTQNDSSGVVACEIASVWAPTTGDK